MCVSPVRGTRASYSKWRIAVRGSVTHFAVRRETHEMPVIGTNAKCRLAGFMSVDRGPADLTGTAWNKLANSILRVSYLDENQTAQAITAARIKGEMTTSIAWPLFTARRATIAMIIMTMAKGTPVRRPSDREINP